MKQIAWSIVTVGLISTPAAAQGGLQATEKLVVGGATAVAAVAQAPAPAAGPAVSATVGVDFPTSYFFRGIRQEADPAFTMQPFVNVAIAASETTTINVGSWNSIHTGSTADGPGAFYESDIYVSAAVAAGPVTPTFQYTAYTSPADAFGTVHELAVLLGFDQPLAPSLTLAFELGENSADGGLGKGAYFDVGIAPALPTGDSPVTLTVPVKLGLSLKDYYEHPLTGDDSKFGYFSVGLTAGASLTERVEVHGGVQFLALGDTLELFNDGASQVIGNVGLSIGF